MIEHIRQELVARILEADRNAANALLNEWAAKHSFEQAVIEILEPALDKIGKLWETTDTLSLAQGYVAGKISEDFMIHGRARYGAQTKRQNITKPVVLGNIEDDYHSLGRKLVRIFLRSAGWDTYDLGNDTLAEEFIDTALQVDANVIGVSAMMYTTAMNIKKLREEIEKRGLSGQIKLAVGGAVFRLRPELVQEVGGDGTSDSAIHAPALFEKLWHEAQEGTHE